MATSCLVTGYPLPQGRALHGTSAYVTICAHVMSPAYETRCACINSCVYIISGLCI